MDYYRSSISMCLSSSWVHSQTTFSSSFVIRFGTCDLSSGHWNLNGSYTVISRPYPDKSPICNSPPLISADFNKLRQEQTENVWVAIYTSDKKLVKQMIKKGIT